MQMKRNHSIFIGVFYIIAAVSSIIAVMLYQPVLSQDWYLAVGNGQGRQVLFGVLNDLLLVVSAVGTAVMFFPYLRKTNEHIALFHLSFRFMEAVVIMIGLVGILGLYTLSQSYAGALLSETGSLLATGVAFQSLHRWTFLLGPNLMLGLNTTAYSYLLFKSRLVPRPLAVFGMITAVMVFFAGLMDLFGVIAPDSAVKGLLALPVGIYEMSLAAYLIYKGIRRSKTPELS
ncbi:MAG: DUF4386 domain-containing protein [Clostridiaceae bacterium]